MRSKEAVRTRGGSVLYGAALAVMPVLFLPRGKGPPPRVLGLGLLDRRRWGVRGRGIRLHRQRLSLDYR